MANPSPAGQRRGYKHYDQVMAAFVTVLLCSELIGVTKVVDVEGFKFGGGILFSP